MTTTPTTTPTSGAVAKPFEGPAHQRDVGYPQLPEPDIAVCNDGKAWVFTNKDVVGEPYYTADQMRAYVDSDRAARKQGAMFEETKGTK